MIFYYLLKNSKFDVLLGAGSVIEPIAGLAANAAISSATSCVLSLIPIADIENIVLKKNYFLIQNIDTS